MLVLARLVLLAAGALAFAPLPAAPRLRAAVAAPRHAAPWDPRGGDTGKQTPAQEKASAAAATKLAIAKLTGDKTVQAELGSFDKMTQMINSGSPSAGTVQVRFNASFRRKGQGNVAKALPFMGGQTNERVGRGTQVVQVKAAVKGGKLTSLVCYRDLGYGRALQVRV